MHQNISEEIVFKQTYLLSLKFAQYVSVLSTQTVVYLAMPVQNLVFIDIIFVMLIVYFSHNSSIGAF